MPRLLCALAIASAAACGVAARTVRADNQPVRLRSGPLAVEKYNQFLKAAGVKVHPHVVLEGARGRLVAVAGQDMQKGAVVCEVRSDQLIEVQEHDEEVTEWARKVRSQLDERERALLTEEEVELAVKLLLSEIDVTHMSPNGEARTKCWPSDILHQRAVFHNATSAFGNACKHLGLVTTPQRAQATLLHVMLHATRMPGSSRRSIVPFLHTSLPSLSGAIAPHRFVDSHDSQSATFTATFALTRSVSAGSVLTAAIPPGRPLSSVIALTGDFPDSAVVTSVQLQTTWTSLGEDAVGVLKMHGCIADGAETRGITLVESGDVIDQQSLRCVTIAAAAQVATAVAEGRAPGVKAESAFADGKNTVTSFDFSDLALLPKEVRLAGIDLFLDVVGMHEDTLPDEQCKGATPPLLRYNAKQRSILHNAAERLSNLAEDILAEQRKAPLAERI